MSDRCQIVIPARLASTRLPEKLLRRVGGKTILQYTYEAALESQVADGVVVAVDDEKIARAVDDFGGQWIMTPVDCASGTDRIAIVADVMNDVDVFVNVQGDEPEIKATAIDAVAAALLNSGADMATAGAPIRCQEVLQDPSNVKIVMAADTSNEQGRAGQGRAVYFSRSVVPHVRDGLSEGVLNAEPPVFWHHLGLYAYRREFLAWFQKQQASPLELTEKLEQLRAIEAGKTIVVARVESAAPGIDTQADLDAFASRHMNSD